MVDGGARGRGRRRRGRLGARAAPLGHRHRGGDRRRHDARSASARPSRWRSPAARWSPRSRRWTSTRWRSGRFIARARHRASSGSTRTGTTPGGASRSATCARPSRIVRRLHRPLPDGEPIDVDGEYEHVRIKGYQRPYHQPARRDPALPRGHGPGHDAIAAEIGDGWISHELCSPAFVREQVLPSIADGARARRARRATDVDLVVSACCAVDADGAAARRRAAGIVGFYASVRTYADFFAFHGFADDQARVHRGVQVRRGHRAAARRRGAATPWSTPSPSPGTPDDVRGAARRVRRRRRQHQAHPADPRPRRRTRSGRRSRPRSSHSSADLRGRDRPMTALPLQDVRIIAVEQYGAGPWGTCTSPTSAPRSSRSRTRPRAATSAATCRRTPRARTRCSSRSSTATSAACRSTSPSPEGRAVFEDLVRNADAVYSNLRGDVPRRSGSPTTTSSTSTRRSCAARCPASA